MFFEPPTLYSTDTPPILRDPLFTEQGHFLSLQTHAIQNTRAFHVDTDQILYNTGPFTNPL